MAPLSSTSIISWSVNSSCVLDVVTCFGIVLCTGTFKNGIMYPFTKYKISWSWVNFPSLCWNELILLPFASLGFFPRTIFLLKGEHLLEILLGSILEIFWTRETGFEPELCLPDTPLFHLLLCFPPLCALCPSRLFGFFYCSKISLHHMVCCCSVKGLSERTFWQKEECYNSHQKKPKKILIAFLKEICLFLQNMFCFFGVLC